MPEIIDVHEAQAQFSQLLERARAGEELLLAKAGKPYARLVPLEKPKREREKHPKLGDVLNPLSPWPDDIAPDDIPDLPLQERKGF